MNRVVPVQRPSRGHEGGEECEPGAIAAPPEEAPQRIAGNALQRGGDALVWNESAVRETRAYRRAPRDV